MDQQVLKTFIIQTKKVFAAANKTALNTVEKTLKIPLNKRTVTTHKKDKNNKKQRQSDR